MPMKVPPSVTPMPLDEAAQLISEGTIESLAKLVRDQKVQDRYEARLEEISKEYASTADYIAASIFKVPTSKGADGRQVAAPIPDDGQPIWTHNEFPYNFEEGVEHHLLWHNRALSEAELEAAIEQRFPGRKEVHWVNPMQLRTITTIWHAHIAVQLKD